MQHGLSASRMDFRKSTSAVIIVGVNKVTGVLDAVRDAFKITQRTPG
jgi:hypothetical protein